MELVLDRRILWDKCRLKEIEEAKKQYREYKRQGYSITLPDKTTPIDKFNSTLEEIVVLAKRIITKHVMKVLNAKGDDRIVWDKDNGPEAKQAKRKFNELIGKGYKAYSLDRKGKKNKRITEFDIDAEEILMVPETARG